MKVSERPLLGWTQMMQMILMMMMNAAQLHIVVGYSLTSRRSALLSIGSTTAATIGLVAASSSQTLLLTPESCHAAAEDAAAVSSPPLSTTSTAGTAGTAAAKFQRYPQIRFIAALGDPQASFGTGADQWGLWRDDPGPRGVFLRDYERQLANSKKPNGNTVAPAGWTFSTKDWWLEEHGLVMSTPDVLPRKKFVKATQQVLPYRRYIVTGDRQVTTVLTVFDDGRWELAKGATLYDVTHLPCRSARYTPLSSTEGGITTTTTCLPSQADGKNFPVRPGAAMPPVAGCNKQDYAVLFVLGEEV
jgi:hypothetical protein